MTSCTSLHSHMAKALAVALSQTKGLNEHAMAVLRRRGMTDTSQLTTEMVTEVLVELVTRTDTSLMPDAAAPEAAAKGEAVAEGAAPKGEVARIGAPAANGEVGPITMNSENHRDC